MMDQQMRTVGSDKLDELTENLRIIKDLVQKGIITENLGNYAGQLMVIDFASWEANYYASQGDLEMAVQALSEAKVTLDGVAIRCMDISTLRPKSKNHRALYEEAKSRYDQAELELVEIWRKRAA